MPKPYLTREEFKRLNKELKALNSIWKNWEEYEAYVSKPPDPEFVEGAWWLSRCLNVKVLPNVLARAVEPLIVERDALKAAIVEALEGGIIKAKPGAVDKLRAALKLK